MFAALGAIACGARSELLVPKGSAPMDDGGSPDIIPDASVPPPPFDGGPEDAGFDAGPEDAGFDAGDGGVCPTPPADERVLQLAVGGSRSCAVLSGGAVKCWGYVYGGYLGLGDTKSRGDQPGEMGAHLPAVDLGTGKTAVAVSLGYVHTCALLSDGSVKCWGGNYRGTLGLGDTNDRGNAPGQMGDALPAVDLGTGRKAVAVSAGHFFTCALLDDGSVKCWGVNGWGALGLGDTIDRGGQPGQMGDALPAVDLGTGRKAIAISAGSGSDPFYDHACALLDDGSVKCWGSNGEGELGQGDTVNRGGLPGQMGDNLKPVDLGTGKTAVAVGAGYGVSCALLNDSHVKCWGAGGELGLGDVTGRGAKAGQMGDALPAVNLGNGATAVAMTAGYVMTCAILAGGSLKCWGANYGGQLGLGDSTDRGDKPGEMGDALPPVDLGACHVAAVALGNAGSGGDMDACALLGNGTVKCWGAGGPLGLGDLNAHGKGPNQMGDDLPTVKLFSDAW
jgi:alpha-tubulin suppressor-like RCC1 family protein